MFKNFKSVSSRCYVSLHNAQTTEIVGMGHIVLTSGMLRNVLCVPKFKYNFLSVSRMAKDNHIRVVVYDEFCFI